MTLLDGNTFTAVLTTVLGTTVLRVSGEVDSATSERLRAHLDDLLDVDDPPMSLVVDVSGMTFIDTTGLNVLVAALRRMRVYGGELTLSAPTAATRKLLAITGLDRAFTVTRA